MQEVSELKKRMGVGAIWMTFLRMSYRLIGLVSTVILARLLSPNDFGIVAIAMSLFAFVELFSNFGFDTVLIQKEKIERSDYDTAWTFNFIFGLTACFFLVIVSGVIADFYENDNLQYVIIAVSVMLMLHGLQNIGVVDFRKNMTFDKEFKFQIVPKLLSFIITIAVAIITKNYWALVVGNIAWKLLVVVQSYVMHAYRPRFSLASSRELFSFSKWLVVNNIFNFFNNRSAELMLGKIVSPTGAAIFALAYELGTMATMEVIANVNRAIYPGYAKLSSNPEALAHLYRETMASLAAIALPLGVGLSMVAEPVVKILLGDKWLEAIPLLELIAVGGALFALNTNATYLYFSLAKPRIATLELLIRTLIFVPALIYFTFKNGVLGGAQAFSLTCAIMFFVSSTIVSFQAKISLWDLVSVYLRPLLAVTIMALTLVGLDDFFTLSPLIQLALKIAIGCLVYISVMLATWVVAGRPPGLEMFLLQLVNRSVKFVITK